jgi:two-component system, LuxR family, sensor histidine kinase DctS
MNAVVNRSYRAITSSRIFYKLLWLALLSLAFVIVFFAGNWAENRALKDQTEAIQSAIAINSLGLRSNAEKFKTLPYTIALQPDIIAVLKSNDDTKIRQLANGYLEDVNLRAGSDVLYVMNTQGETIASSNWDSPKSFVGQNYANRPYFIDALSGKTGLFYGIGQTTAIPGLFIATPVVQNAAVIGVVVIKVSLRDIEAAWVGLPAPIMVSDARGIFFLGSVPAWKFQSQHVLKTDDLQWVSRHKQYGDRQEFPQVPWLIERLEGNSGYLMHTKVNDRMHRYLVVDQTIPELGWTLTVMADYEPVVWARVMTWIFGALGTGLLIFGGLYWRLKEKRLIEQSMARQELELRVIERTSELREAHAFQQAMENSLLVGMRARDLDGRIIYVNSAFCEMTGYSANTLVGSLPPYPYWHQDDLARHWSDNTTSMSGNAALTGFESRIKHHDGHDVFTMVYTAPLVDAAGKHKGWMSSVVDITEQKNAEEKQRLHDIHQQHTGRLTSMGEMASTLAHELNQPLMALCNFASAASAFAKQGNQTLLVSSLQEITMQAQRSADIVKRIRGFVRPITTGIEVCQMNKVVGNVLALLKPEIKLHNTRVNVQLMDDLPAVAGDYVLLEQVLVNLILNSLQAMQNIPRKHRCIEIETLFLLTDQSVCVKVADNGTGITSEIATQLFEPFYTTKPEGLGLGLNICRTIVESHKGQLSFENRPNGGSIFTLKIQALI